MTVRFKDLCINSTSPAVAAEFWAAALGLRSEPSGDAFVLRGDSAEQTVWVNRVEVAKQGKTRVHLDLNVRSVAEMLDLGATVLDDTQPGWTVMAAPDTVEFCAFVRPPERIRDQGRLYEVVVDCADAERLCRWWAGVLGTHPRHDDGTPWWWLELPDESGRALGMVFVPVPEAKVLANWVHWDVLGRTREVVDAGARVLRVRDDKISWDVLGDPEGNEFCVFSG